MISRRGFGTVTWADPFAALLTQAMSNESEDEIATRLI